MNTTIEQVDYGDEAACAELIALLDRYARDPMGGGEPLGNYCKDNLASSLATIPGALSLLARVDGVAVGFCNCFPGFSTFACAPLINIHDIAVNQDYRGQGIASQLIAEVAREAVKRGCCKITLEVLVGNQVARRVYQFAGFAPSAADSSDGPYEFWEKALC